MSNQKRIHPNAPERLKVAYIEAGRNIRALAKKLNVNPFYVHAAIKNNTPPADKKMQYTLFFKVRKKREPVPQWKKDLKKIPKSKQETILKALLSGEYTIVKKDKVKK